MVNNSNIDNLENKTALIADGEQDAFYIGAQEMEEALVDTDDDAIGSIHKSPREIDVTELEDDEEHDFSMIPVHSTGVGTSLPAAEEIHINRHSGLSLCARRCWKIVAIVVVVVAALVGVGTAISLGTKTLVMDVDKMNMIIEYLVREGAATHGQLEETDSPQFKAAEWLSICTQWDVPKVSMDEDVGYRFVVRYVMAVNFFSLGGNQWIDRLHFLNHNMDVCDWDGIALHGTEVIKKAGVVCDPNKRPMVLNLCK
jgi:hypothetical protein